MNTNNLKKYAPQARRQFLSAVLKRINELGVYSDTQIGEASLQGDIYSIEGRNFGKSVKPQRERLVTRVKNEGFLHLVEQVSSTWFNRFCAIRFMELKDGYLGHYYRVLSDPNNPKGYEILDHAQDVAQDLDLNKEEVIELKLAGNKEEELFRKLLLAQCHQLHIAMPFLFEALDDETELLLPQNLMRTDSILRGLIDDIPESDWLQVEVIGWLYQFYISEKKDQVMGKVVKSEDIPAATQLFTPDWIVQYLVQNSVARQWLEVKPESDLIAKLKELSREKFIERAVADGKSEQEIDAIEGEEFYIQPAEQTDAVNTQLKAQIPESLDPESIKVIDPACGSGHILIEAYNVLNLIYQEEGYVPRKIPQLILENNLFGLDIDDRAAQLTGFALMMMARKDDPRIFTRGIKLNTLVVKESTHLNISELWKDLDLDNKQPAGSSADLFAISDNADVIDAPEFKLLKQCKTWFLQADTLGSLINVPNEYESQLKDLYRKLQELLKTGSRVKIKAAVSILPFVHQALLLSQRYDSLIANPPYMGIKGMNNEIKMFGKINYPNSKVDLFSMFMERAFDLLKENGINAQVNMQSWMFLSSFEKLRLSIVEKTTFLTMAHLGPRAFSQISGEVVQTVAWVLAKRFVSDYQSTIYRLVEGVEKEKRIALANKQKSFSKTKQRDFCKIPGSPIVYWVNETQFSFFTEHTKLSQISSSANGVQTTDNERFLRYWFEIDQRKANHKWFPYNKGGSFRKWYGNIEHYINWENDGREISKIKNARRRGDEFYFKEGLTWSDVTTGKLSSRYLPKGCIFDAAGPCAFFDNKNDTLVGIALLNTMFVDDWSKILNPTLHFQAGDFQKLTIADKFIKSAVPKLASEAIDISKDDWDSSETSWDFLTNQLINLADSPKLACEKLLNSNEINISRLKKLEKEINNIFVQSYDLVNKNITPEIEDISLRSNPSYRYSIKSNRLNIYMSDLICEHISFSIGVIMGRFSLDRKGLVYANSGNEGFELLVTEGAYKSFPADDDAIIPLTDEEWFDDDATIRFRDFVSKVWGDANLVENLEFVAESLCLHALQAKSGESPMATIRRYLSTQFYKDHLKTYKKRPIYWLFSSGKEKAFECLVYLHRYNEGTLARMRTQYVTPLLGKQDARIGQLEQKLESASTSEATKLKRAITSLEKKQAELRKFDDKLKHYADMRIPLNLDDGVKVNYGKFGDLLAEVKAIHGKIVK